MKSANDAIGNRTRDIPACNTVSRPTASPGDTIQHIPKLQHSVIKKN